MLSISEYLHHPEGLASSLVLRYGKWLPDIAYLKLLFRYRMGKKLDLKHPQTYSEKLQWLKLYDRNPLYTTLVDKHEVKTYVAEHAGSQYVIPELGLWDTPAEIDWDSLPQSFVLKTTHGGGNIGVVVCKNKDDFDRVSAIKKLGASMQQNLYRDSREWPYKNIRKRVFAEAYMEDAATKELRDYKFFCFDGEVKFLFVGSERQKKGEDVKFDFFDKDYNHLILRQGHPNAKVLPEKPSCFEEMKDVATALSKGLPHVRVDLYEADGHVYFGELTFYHFGGMVRFEPEEWDYKFGSWLKLPEIIRD
jgi:hypothetical protein